MTDKELLYIKTIAEEHNITKAAEKLHVAQPSLTQCIKRIEKKPGLPPFLPEENGPGSDGRGKNSTMKPPAGFLRFGTSSQRKFPTATR